MNPKLTALLQELRQGLEDLYGDRFVKLILYGSQARGEAHDESDIDVMVVLKSDTSVGNEIFRIGKITNTLGLKYDELISAIPISEVDFQRRVSPFMSNVRREGIVV